MGKRAFKKLFAYGSELGSSKTSVLDTFCVCLSVGGGLGYEWGLDAPAPPSATIL